MALPDRPRHRDQAERGGAGIITAITAGAAAVYLVVTFVLVAVKMIAPKVADYARANDSEWSDEHERIFARAQDVTYWRLLAWPVRFTRAALRMRKGKR